MNTSRFISMLLCGSAVAAFLMTPPLSPQRNTFLSHGHTNDNGRKRSIPCYSTRTSLQASSTTDDVAPTQRQGRFNLTTALFCAGLAFDAYAEPPSNSSRWERGSQGTSVAFLSPAFTRNLYKGLVQVQPIKCTDLPDEDSTAEGLLSGGGVDAFVMVALVEEFYKDDVQMLERAEYHEGVVGLRGAAHVGRSRTAWSNMEEYKSRQIKRATGVAPAYHVKSTWGKGGQAIFGEDEPPFYLYVQEPSTVRLVFSIADDNVVEGPEIVASAHRRLSDLIPLAKASEKEVIERLKEEALQQLKEGDVESLLNYPMLRLENKGWSGKIKMKSKPRKKDKKGQMALGAIAGAAVAGPLGAAVGGALGSMYEGEVRGSIELKLSYLPFPGVEVKRPVYKVKGGLPGLDWDGMYSRFVTTRLLEPASAVQDDAEQISSDLLFNDFEQCFFINHDDTGGSCSVYRSLEKRLIVVSFRGTCVPKDLFTDASIAQDAWVEGEDVKQQDIPKVHSGFRRSMNSISRRLKELVLAAVAPGEDMSQYDMIITGHSLGAALATLFVVDIAESGIDAGRALPQTDPSDAWWKSIANTFMGKDAMEGNQRTPPRPKSLKMYNFGSPRVGNPVFAAMFDSLVAEGKIDEAYRIVNGEDLVARHPRSMNALVFGNVAYEHCAPTVLVTMSSEGENVESEAITTPKIWVEGESDDGLCPVRDGKALTSPLADGSLLNELLSSTQELWNQNSATDGPQLASYASTMQRLASKLSDRLQTVSATDIASIAGINKKFTEREIRMIESILRGEALAHHMEDEYYTALGRACGFQARVGEELQALQEPVAENGTVAIV